MILCQRENGDRFDESASAFFERCCRRGDLFDEGGILLRHFIHLCHGFVDLSNSAALLYRSRGDRGHDLRDALDRFNDFRHRRARLSDELRAGRRAFDGVADELLDFFGRRGRTILPRPGNGLQRAARRLH